MQKSQAISKNCQAKLGLAIFGDCLTFYSIPAIIFAKMPAISLFLLALIAALVIESLSSYRAVEMQRSRL
jgi:hypothetical protein